MSAVVTGARDLAEMVACVETRADCEEVAELVAQFAVGVEAGRRTRAGEQRHPVVRALGAAVMYLRRGGAQVPVERARRLAGELLVEVAERLESGA